jgi:hypothetical protein
MSGIRTSNRLDTVAWHVGGNGRGVATTSSSAPTHQIPPSQGGVDSFGPSSQGVALGWRVTAPLARMSTVAVVVVPAGVNTLRGMCSPLRLVLLPASQPEGHQLVSPGQRPGNSKPCFSPERATPGPASALARNLKHTFQRQVLTLQPLQAFS